MVIYGVIKVLAQGVAENAALRAWCQEHYGKDPVVFVGIDQKRPPSPSDVPFVAFSSSESTEKGLLSQGALLFDVIWGVANEEKTVTGNLVEYDGARECDEMGSLVAAALERVEPSFTVASGTYDIDLSTPWFPLWCGVLTLNANLRR